MAEQRVPDISKALLDWLDSMIPEPRLEDELKMIYARLGQRELFNNIRIHYNRQNGITKE